ncbi:MAG: pirin family protein [Pseudomonadota bacterium]|jgi:redox-sensitive bicupin YhaK (pirin superfamily)|nr:pirin family protein [Pseudomonadota bacterium]
MSNLNDNGDVVECPNLAGRPTLEAVPSHRSVLGSGLPIIRHLPSRRQRLIGPWCFLDHIGPTSLSADSPVDVGTHPHTGLQTVTWLFEGALLHKDSLGYEQVIEPGQLNLMTAGHGICHSEESPPGFSGPMHGLQFWIALPGEHEDTTPAFAHHTDLPHWEKDGMSVTLVVGELDGRHSPAKVFSPLVGADIEAHEGGTLTLPVPASFELGLCINQGHAHVEGNRLDVGELYYLGQGREQLTLTLEPGSRVMLLGGEPLHQPVLLWWNFVGRDQARLEQAVADWDNWPNNRFGEVTAYQGKPLKAPRLDSQVRLKG